MRMRDLAWMVAVAETGHVTEAADELGTPQPTLSRAVGRVEAELGVMVFERRHDGVTTTALGELVVAAARDLVGRHAVLLADLERVLSPERGVVRLAFLDSMATSLVPRLLRAFHEEAPGVRLELSQEPGHEILADLRAGAVDLGLTSPRPEGDWGWLPLTTERLLAVVPPRHRLAGRRRIDLTELADDELVTTPPGFAHRALVDGLLADAGVAPRVAFESQDLATIEGLVAAGLGVAVIPEAFVGLSGTVGLALRTAGARRTIGLTWRSDRELPPPARRFVSLAREADLG